MSVPDASRQRRVSWDVLRVLCVLMVLAFHATYVAPLIEPSLEPRRFTFPVQIGASSLLLISAYFVARSLSRAQPWGFWWNRICRLLPPFAVSVLLTWAVVRVAAPEDWFRPSMLDLAGNLLMLWSVYPDVPFIDGSYWTLPLQLLAFTVAAVLAASSWGSGRRLWLILWSAVLIPLAQWPLRSGAPSEMYRATVDTLGFHRLHLFVLGVGLWLWASRRISHLHWFALAVSCLAGHAAHTLGDFESVLALAVMVALCCLAARGPDWGQALPPVVQALVRWLAGISYGVYLLHQTLGYLLMRWVKDHGGGPVLEVLAMAGLAVLLGWLLTELVERPVSRAAARWSFARRAAVRSAA